MEKVFVQVLTIVFGAISGSFATLLIHRLHFDEKGIFYGRSKCPNCQTVLRFWNLVPLFSWLFQKGKCTACGKKISIFYPLTELTFMTVFFVFGQKFYGSFDLIPLLICIFFLLVLFFYDLYYFEVDDRIIYPAVIFAIAWSFFREESWSVFFLGAATGFAFYALQYYCSKGRWVGSGDMRLGLFMGGVLGIEKLLFALLVAYVTGSIVALFLLLFKKFTRKSALPMGAFLMPSTILFLYAGFELIDWYWRVVVSF